MYLMSEPGDNVCYIECSIITIVIIILIIITNFGLKERRKNKK